MRQKARAYIHHECSPNYIDRVTASEVFLVLCSNRSGLREGNHESQAMSGSTFGTLICERLRIPVSQRRRDCRIPNQRGAREYLRRYDTGPFRPIDRKYHLGKI